MNYFVANLKMYLSLEETESLVKEVLKGLEELGKKSKDLKIIICPSFPALHSIHKLQPTTYNLELGSQDLFWQDKGAYTGQVSCSMLKELGVSYAIIGHSEKRAVGETDEMINKKVKASLGAGIVPVVCVGETVEERRGGQQKKAVVRDLTGGLVGIKEEELKKLIIAYEPIWAIGTGKHCQPRDAEIMAEFIREKMGDIPVIYGGSVTSANIQSFVGRPAINGVLVGSASTKPEEFIKMIKAIC
jgi:triosephosphate isomerase